MSIKFLVFAAALGAGAYSVSKTEPPIPPTATAADSVALADVSFNDRFQYRVGTVGAAILGSSIRKSVFETETTLAAMKGSIKNAKGPTGVRVRDLAKKITYIDSVAVEHLQYGRPIKAMKQSMEAKSLMNVVKNNLRTGV